MNLAAIDDLVRRFPALDMVLVESGGDNLAATFSPECLRNGLRIPDDVALVGANSDSFTSEGINPKLSSTEYGHDRIGWRAAELLHSLMEGGTPPTEPILVPPLEVIARQSTDVIAVDDRLVARSSHGTVVLEGAAIPDAFQRGNLVVPSPFLGLDSVPRVGPNAL